MYLYFNFLITWVNNYGIITRQVWLHFANWSPAGWIRYVLIAVTCARIRQWGAPFLVVLHRVCLCVLSPSCIFYGGSCPWLCSSPADPCKCCSQRLILLKVLRLLVSMFFPLTNCEPPGGRGGAIISMFLSTVFTLELCTLWVRGYK